MTSRGGKITTESRIRPRPIILLLFLSLVLLTGVYQTSGYENSSAEASSPKKGDETYLMAFVIPKSASGHSYWAERDSIVTMDRLETLEEMQAFVKRYEPLPETQALIQEYLMANGFTLIAQDNLFTVVTGTLDTFEVLTGKIPVTRSKDGTPLGNVIKMASSEMKAPQKFASQTEGMIIKIVSDIEQDVGNKLSVLDTSIVSRCPEGSLKPDDIIKALKIDRLHEQGYRGDGIDIAFIDDGLFSGHDFFLEEKHAVDMSFYEFTLLHGIQLASSTYKTRGRDDDHSGHGFLVASYLAAAAPEAKIRAYARPVPSNIAPKEYFAAYLAYIKAYNPTDILSISFGKFEDEVEDISLIAEIRTELISLMSDRTIVLIAGGNANYTSELVDIIFPSSGQNAYAAIPEVLAIGGSSIMPIGDRFEFEAAGQYLRIRDGSTGAASFDSVLYPGRHVPDVVGIFGNPDALKLCYPYPISHRENGIDNLNGYAVSNTNGTSGATPQIAGMAALLKQRYPWISQPQMRSLLQQNALDITEGVSGDGDEAGPGYDPATGYGQPVATWAMQAQVPLESGMNLIGVTAYEPYTVVKLFDEIADQGGSCDYLGYWSTSKGKYVGSIYEQGELYGDNFSIKPEVGYWLRCQGKFIWEPGGNGFIALPQPIQFKAGWNSIAVPYSDAPCTSGELYQGTGESCYRVLRFDGMLQETQSRLTNSGRDFPLHPGEGYLVYCDPGTDVTWTPVCTDDNANASAGISTSSAAINLIGERAIKRMQDKISAAERRTRSLATAGECALQDGRPLVEANVTNQQFTVNWLTDVPCMGSVILLDEYGFPSKQVSDDRGNTYSGITHHVTIRGLEPKTTYTYGILSGEAWYDAEEGTAIPFTVTTSNVVEEDPMGNEYNINGNVLDANGTEILDGFVRLRLEGETSSGYLSFPLGEDAEGYLLSLENARNPQADDYYDFLAARTVDVQALANAGSSSINEVGVNLFWQPQVDAGTVRFGNKPPEKTTLLSPTQAESLITRQPTLQFSAQDKGSDRLTYRVELSKDGFSTVAYTYDQRVSAVGWSASSYAPGETAIISLPQSLENLVGYQWRAYAYDGASWGPVSSMGTFSILIPPAISASYLPFVSTGGSPVDREKDFTGIVSASGAAVVGQTIVLNRHDSSGTSALATTVTDNQGHYAFENVSLPQDGSTLAVRWMNSSDNEAWLSTWACWKVSVNTTNSDAFQCDFDIANVELLSPNHESTVSLPHTYSWEKRAISTDTYEFNLADMEDYVPHWWTDPHLGYTGQYNLTSLPTGFSTNTSYGWWVWVYGPDGYGLPYYYRLIQFNNQGSLLDGEAPTMPFSELKDFADQLAPPRPQP